eukprot:403366246
MLPQQKLQEEAQKARQQQQAQNYDLKGRDPKGLLLEKDIHIEEQDKNIKALKVKLQEIQRINLELEQDLAMSKKRFKDLLQERSLKQPRVSDIAFQEMERENQEIKNDMKAKENEMKYLYEAQSDLKVVQRQNDSLQLRITEQSIENKELKDQLAFVQYENMRLKTDQELNQVTEIDKKIDDLIFQVKDYKLQAEKYRQQYIEAMKDVREMQIEKEAKERSGGGWESELINVKKMQQQTDLSLQDLNRRYQEQINMNTELRKRFNEIYVILITKKYQLPKDVEEMFEKSIRLGMVSPIGVGVKESWKNILAGKSGIVSVKDDPEFKGLKSQIGGKLPSHFILKDHETSFGDTRIFSLANTVTKEAIQDAKLDFDGMNRSRVGIVLANQFGALENYNKPNDKLRLLKTMNHMVPSLLAIQHQLKGPVSAVSMASSSGTIAIGESYRLIKHGHSDVVITGGVDFNLNRHFFEGMELFGANCNQFNDKPELASMPFDKKRSGPIMSDGGGALILETLESALERNAQIYCEIVGYSQNTDAFHILRPTDKGEGLLNAILQALIEAQITPNMIDHINSHATSTPAGDLSEAECHKHLLGIEDIWSNYENLKSIDYLDLLKHDSFNAKNMKKAIINANKGNIGHTFCAAGAIESIFAIMSMKESMIPKILNLQEPLNNDLNFAMENVQKKLDVVVKTSLAFGGVNSALVFKAYKENQAKL